MPKSLDREIPSDKENAPVSVANKNATDEMNESTHRAVLIRAPSDSVEVVQDFSDDEDFGLGYANGQRLSEQESDEDDFDEFFDNDVYRAADEELSIVNAYEIGIGYGLDEEELAHLTGRPD